MKGMDKKSLNELLSTIALIALYKSWLPFDLRGWVNALGLHVQERKAGRWTRLQAGGSLRSYIDAWREGDGDWQVKKFDEETWERRFAHLVGPTYEIADFLSQRVHWFGDLDAEGAAALNDALQHYHVTGVWSGLPRVSEDAIDRALEERAGAEAKEEHNIRIRLIADNEKRVRKDPVDRSAWNSLADLYLKEQRYKDAENALKMQLIAEESKGYMTCLQLGELYLAALSTSIRGKGIPIWGYILPSNVKPGVLNHTLDQLRTLAMDNLSKAYKLLKKAGFKDTDPWIGEVELALEAASTLTVEAFEEFDIAKEQQRKQKTSQQEERLQELFDRNKGEGRQKDL
jgi:tetratricopeptide (TPR) repeat protein